MLVSATGMHKHNCYLAYNTELLTLLTDSCFDFKHTCRMGSESSNHMDGIHTPTLVRCLTLMSSTQLV